MPVKPILWPTEGEGTVEAVQDLPNHAGGDSGPCGGGGSGYIYRYGELEQINLITTLNAIIKALNRIGDILEKKNED